MNKKSTFEPCLDRYGTRLASIYRRGTSFYASLRLPGGSARFRLLLNEAGKPVTTLNEAITAKSRLMAARDAGLLGKARAPAFKQYACRYIAHLHLSGAKG